MLQTHTISTAILCQMGQEVDHIVLEHQEHLDPMFTTGDQMLNIIILQRIHFKYTYAIQMKQLNGVASLMPTCPLTSMDQF